MSRILLTERRRIQVVDKESAGRSRRRSVLSSARSQWRLPARDRAHSNFSRRVISGVCTGEIRLDHWKKAVARLDGSGCRLLHMSQTPCPAGASSSRSRPPRRSAPSCRSSRAFGATTLRHASVGAAGQALSDLNAFAKHPAFELVAVADVDLCRIEPHAEAVPQGPRLPGLARNAREGAREHRLGERLDPRPHALRRRDGGDEARQAGLRAEAALQHAARRRACSPKTRAAAA